MQGTIVDSRYQIVRTIGQGGMGAVYEARHTGTGRRVALKMITPDALAGGGADIVPRFQREARASGAIDSQHVVQVLDTGVDPTTGTPYLVMEYLAGEDVLHLIHRVGPLPVDVVLRITAQACAGILRAHAEGIVHRDIKSANLFVARREADVVVKILDFGIAKVRVDPMAMGASKGITATGSLLGSPLYMAPEQVIGTKEAEPRSDIFSLGVTMYEMLCGQPPNYECDTIGKLVLAICNGTWLPIQRRAPWVPDDVAAIVAKALAVDMDARYQTPDEMRDAILALLPHGAALHETMLVGLSPAHQSLAPAAAPLESPTLLLTSLPQEPPVEPLAPPRVPPVVDRHAATAGPVVAAATFTSFAESNRDAAPPRRRRWLLMGLAFAFGGSIAGVVIFLLITRTGHPSGSATPTAPTTGASSAAEPAPPALPPPRSTSTEPPPVAAVATAPAQSTIDAGPEPARPRPPIVRPKPLPPTPASSSVSTPKRTSPPASMSADKPGILDTSQ